MRMSGYLLQTAPIHDAVTRSYDGGCDHYARACRSDADDLLCCAHVLFSVVGNNGNEVQPRPIQTY